MLSLSAMLIYALPRDLPNIIAGTTMGMAPFDNLKSATAGKQSSNVSVSEFSNVTSPLKFMGKLASNNFYILFEHVSLIPRIGRYINMALFQPYCDSLIMREVDMMLRGRLGLTVEFIHLFFDACRNEVRDITLFFSSVHLASHFLFLKSSCRRTTNYPPPSSWPKCTRNDGRLTSNSYPMAKTTSAHHSVCIIPHYIVVALLTSFSLIQTSAVLTTFGRSSQKIRPTFNTPTWTPPSTRSTLSKQDSAT